MAVAPLSLRTEDPGLSGVLGMAKVAASGTHLAEARSQSAQGFRVFSFSVRILIFSYFLFVDLIPFGIYFSVISNRCFYLFPLIFNHFLLFHSFFR